MFKLRLVGLALIVLVGAVIIAGCGGGGSSSSESTEASSGEEAAGGEPAGSEEEAGAEEGGGEGTVEVKLGTESGTLPESGAHIGLFMAAVSNEWQKQVVKGAEETAKENGDTVELYDANFDANEQLNQVQNALQKGGMDAAMILPADSNLMCNVMTKQVAGEGIPVVALAVPLCGHETDNGEESWENGTLSYVGGNNTYKYTQSWVEAAQELNPGKKVVALVTGPELLGQTVTTKKVVEELAPNDPEFEVKYFVDTDFTTPNAQAETQTLVKAHPDINLIMSVYSPDLTRGVVSALELEGLDGKIPVDDEGASKYSYEKIESGAIQMTVPYWPYSIGEKGSDAILEAQEGKEVAKFIGEADKGSSEEPLVITKKNLSEFEPQY